MLRKLLTSVVLMGLSAAGSTVYAQDAGAMLQVPSVAQVNSAFEFELNTRLEPYGQPKATSYYDDMVDHYEQDQLMWDSIGQGI